MVSKYLTKHARTYNGVKIVYSVNDVGKIEQIHTKRNSTTFSHHAQE